MSVVCIHIRAFSLMHTYARTPKHTHARAHLRTREHKHPHNLIIHTSNKRTLYDYNLFSFWLLFMNTDSVTCLSSYICGRHFEEWAQSLTGTNESATHELSLPVTLGSGYDGGTV